jgi:hypothetical protein
MSLPRFNVVFSPLLVAALTSGTAFTDLQKAIDRRAAKYHGDLFDIEDAAPAPSAKPSGSRGGSAPSVSKPAPVSATPSGLGGLFDLPAINPSNLAKKPAKAASKPASAVKPAATASASPSGLGGLFDLPDVLPGPKAGLAKPESTPAPVVATPADAKRLGVLPRKDQFGGRAEQNVATLLHRLGMQDHVMDGDEFHTRVHNEPYLPLVVERHKEGDGHKLYLTHYIDDFNGSGDSVMDSEMVYHVHPSGHLSLAETAVRGMGREHRGRDKSFASMFSQNLLHQGFGDKKEIKIQSFTHPDLSHPDFHVPDLEFEQLHPRNPDGKFKTKEQIAAEEAQAQGGAEAASASGMGGLFDAEPQAPTATPQQAAGAAPQAMPPFEAAPADGGANALNVAAQNNGIPTEETPAAEPAPAPTVGATVPPHVKNHMTLATRILDRLGRWEPMNWRELTSLADRSFGGSEVSGAYHARDMYDALEVATNSFIAREIPDLFTQDPHQSLQQLHAIMELLPTQTSRTQTQNDYQQFSTPPTEAFVAVKALGDIRGLRALEPSAGTGSLACMMRLAGATVICNEHPDEGADVRAGLLAAQGFMVSRHDAERLDAFLGGNKFDIVGMNPPFSATAGRTKNNKTQYGAMHVESAISLLHPGGRCVAIVGGGMGESTPTHAGWFAKMAGRVDYRANILIDGDQYSKYGTQFDNRVLVFDKPAAGEQPDRAPRVVVDNAASLDEALDYLDALGVQKTYGTSKSSEPQAAGAGAGAPSEGSGTQAGGRPATDDPAALSGADAPGGAAGVRAGGRSGAGLGDPSSLGQPGMASSQAGDAQGNELPADDRGAGAVAKPGESAGGDAQLFGGGIGTGLPVSSEATPVSQEGGVASADNSVDAASIQRRSLPSAEKSEIEDSTFTPYVADISLGLPHPSVLVETGSMAGVQSPLARMSAEEIARHIHLPKEDLSPTRPGGPALSDAQLEVLVAANMRHEQTLASGHRKGYFSGDGTGVGKGREIAGVIYNNWQQGHKRTAWFTANHKELAAAARRDLGDVAGWTVKPKPDGSGGVAKINSFRIDDYKAGGKEIPGEGVLVCSYDTMKNPARMAQIQAWLNGGAEGSDPVMIFDESHKAANATPGGSGKSSNRGRAVLDIQNANPRARVTYLSATGADKVSNMGYMTRLGLWGEGTAFNGFEDFSSFVNENGVAGMEMVARELKAMGAYTSRSIAFRHPDGKPLTFSESTAPIHEEMHTMYNKAADVWGTVMRKLEQKIEDKELTRDEVRAFKSQYWGAHQRFFKGLINSFKAPMIIDHVERALAEGKAPVISLDSTNEGAMNERAQHAIAEGLELDDVDFSNKDALMAFLEGFWPTQLHQDATNPLTGKVELTPVWTAHLKDGSKHVFYAHSEHGHPYGEQIERVEKVVDPQKVAEKEALQQSAGEIQVPGNLLDSIILHFGHHRVAEISGRKSQLIRDANGNMQIRTRNMPRGGGESVNDYEMKQFNGGAREIAIISRAGAQGISLHASPKFRNQKQRLQIMAELGWQTKDEVQKLGRTHRSDQVTGPEYMLISADIAGDKRFSSALANNMANLGALQKGDRSSSGSGELAKYDFNSQMGETAVRKTMALMPDHLMKTMGLDSDKVSDMNRQDILKAFFNRLLVLPIAEQNHWYEVFDGTFREAVEDARTAGDLDAVRDIDALSIKHVGTQEIARDKDSGAATHLHEFETTHYNGRQYWNSLQGVVGMHGKNPGTLYRNTKGRLGYVIPVKRTNRAGVTEDALLVHYPNGQREYKSPAETRQWERQYVGEGYRRQLPGEEDSREMWDKEVESIPDTRTERLHVVSGLTFPVYNKLAGDKSVVRVSPEGHERVVGVALDKSEINATMKNLGLLKVKRGDPSQVYAAAMGALKGGDAIHLADDYGIKKGFHRGSEALEVFKKNGERLGVADMHYLTSLGLIDASKGAWERRAYIPADSEAGSTAMQKLLERHPVQSLPDSMMALEKAYSFRLDWAEGALIKAWSVMEQLVDDSGEVKPLSLEKSEALTLTIPESSESVYRSGTPSVFAGNVFAVAVNGALESPPFSCGLVMPLVDTLPLARKAA